MGSIGPSELVILLVMLVPVGIFVCFLGVIMSIIYLATVRPKLVLAQQG